MNFWSPYLLWAFTGGALLALYLVHLGRCWGFQRAQKRAEEYPPCDTFRSWARACRVPGIWTRTLVVGLWVVLLSAFPSPVFHYRPSKGFWLFWFGAVALVLVVEHVLESYLRARFAAQVVDMFELDEALHGLAAQRYGAAMEPTRAAYQVALETAYRYVGLVTWGHRPCDWLFTFRARFLTGQNVRGWQIPRYVWLQYIGGPAVVELDPDTVLMTESLAKPYPSLVLPQQHGYTQPRCLYRQKQHLLPLQPSQFSPLQLVEVVETSAIEAEGQEGERLYLHHINACLTRFQRVRYPVLFGLRAQQVSKPYIEVRTRDGLPLRIPSVTVRFELYQEGHILREARNRLPSKTWQRLVNQTLLRLLRKEAAHWRLSSATDLPVRVMQGAIDGAFRKVFARYDAAQLLDRVHRQTLAELLAAQGVRSDSYLKRLLEPYLEGTHTVSVERLHEEILAELNGTAEDGYARAEERGLLVTHLHFGDWKPPKHLHEIHRQALRRLLAWQTEHMPSQSATLRQRARQIFVQDVADSLYSRLPEVTLPFMSTGAHADAPARTAAWIRREWVRTLDQLVQGLRSLSPFDEVSQRVFWSAFDTADPRFIFDPALLNSIDEATRREQLAAWLYEAYVALRHLKPEGYSSVQSEPPAQMLPD